MASITTRLYLAVVVLVGRRDADVEEADSCVELFGDVVLLTARPADRQGHVTLRRLDGVRGRLVRAR